MKSKNEDKRVRGRIPIRDKVQIICDNYEKFITEYADNISIGGMFIKTDKPFPIGTQFGLELTIGNEDKRISAVGEVVWTKEFGATVDKRPSGMGIRFIELRGKSKLFIKELIEKDLSDKDDVVD